MLFFINYIITRSPVYMIMSTSDCSSGCLLNQSSDDLVMGVKADLFPVFKLQTNIVSLLAKTVFACLEIPLIFRVKCLDSE